MLNTEIFQLNENGYFPIKSSMNIWHKNQECNRVKEIISSQFYIYNSTLYLNFLKIVN